VAHKILGVDLGASSFKLALFEAGFRKAGLLEAHLLPAPPAQQKADAIHPAERLASQLRALKQALDQHNASSSHPIAAEEMAIGLPGEILTFRVIDLPFSDPRKIDSVLGYELESQILTGIDELIIDYLIVGPRGAQTRVLVAAAPRPLVEGTVKVAAELGLPVRTVGAAPFAYAASLHDPAPTLVIDVGHAHTHVCALRGGKPELARSIPRAGRHLTDAIAATFHLDAEAAERAKLEAGFLGHAGLRPETPGQIRMDQCLRDAMKPLVRELRQTLASYRASYSEPLVKVALTGGGGRLVGLAEHLAEELELPVTALPWPAPTEPGGWAPIDTYRQDRLAVAIGLAMAGAASAPQVNFRKGEFAYRSDYSFLRGKALYLGAALLLVLGFAALNAFASLRGLRHEQESLSARLRRETTELFGSERTDAKAISDELKGGPKGSGPVPIPTTTAFDVLDEISRATPPNDKLQLDILELDVKPKKTYLKATVKSAQQVDDLVAAFKKIECFEDIQTGKLTKISGPVNPPQGGTVPTDKEKQAAELTQFTLNIATTCP
jgi:general secretion pathway protein L